MSMHAVLLRSVPCAAMIALCLTPCIVHAACSPIETFPVSAAAMHSWETRHEAELTPRARERVYRSLCAGILDVSRQAGSPADEIDAGSQTAVWKYLDALSAPAASVPSFKDVLAEDFILNAKPEPQVPQGIAALRVIYHRPADQLLINGDVMPAVGRLLAEYGTLTIRGREHGQTVCQGSVTIAAGLNNTFIC